MCLVTDTPVTFKPEELEITPIPKQSQHGMITNTRTTGMTIKHISTGLCVTVSGERSEHMNRDKAMRYLATIVALEHGITQEDKMNERFQREIISALTKAQQLDEYQNPYLVIAIVDALNEHGVEFDYNGLSEWANSLWSR